MAVGFDEESIKQAQTELEQLKNSEPTEDQQELTIEQEYELWKKNCPFMYDFVYESNLKWPSLSVQWLPSVDYNEENKCINTSLLLGTNTSGEEHENVKIVNANLPSYISTRYEDQSLDVNGISKEGNQKTQTKIKIKKKLDHFDSEVNRTRYMPQNSKIISSISGTGTAYIYANSDIKKLNRGPVLTLGHHKDNGYGLDWSTFKEGHLLTAADDKTICLWDINSKSIKLEEENQNAILKPLNALKFHEDIVNDVKWHKFNGNLFGSVSDDKSLLVFDTRDLRKPAISKPNVHDKSVNALSFSPFSKYLLATGSSDATVGLFDLRNLNSKLHSMMGHSESITTLEWSPHVDGFLASGSEDRRVIVWDVARIGEEQNQEDADDGAPEIFMMHAGHTGLVTDLNWHPDESLKWLVASVSDNNVVQLWKVNRNLSDPVDGWANEDVDLAELE